MNQITLRQYSDPKREHLAEIAKIYLNKSDDDPRRPLRLIEQGHTAFLKSQFVRFEYQTSAVAYSHLATYSLANGTPPLELRACQSLRATKGANVYIPDETRHPKIVTAVVEQNFDDYVELLEEEKPQVARYAAPQGTMVKYTLSWSFLLLAKHFFPERLWTPGALPETKEVAEEMWFLVAEQDRELWQVIYEQYGPHRGKESKAMDYLRKNKSLDVKELQSQLQSVDPQMSAYDWLLNRFGKNKSMWE